MRIAMLSTPFVDVPPRRYGGTELVVYELCEGLSRRGLDVTLFATGSSRTRVPVRALFASPSWPPDPLAELEHVAWALEEIARDGTFDVVHAHCAAALPLAARDRLPIAYTVHHEHDQYLAACYARHPEVTYVTISERQRALLGLTPPSVHTVHHGIDPDRYAADLSDGGYVAFLGRFAAVKGLHLAIGAAREAGLPLRAAGAVHPGDRDYFAEQVAPLLGDGIELMGEADHEAKVALLRGARALVCPLQWEEPFGLVMIEAMLCGAPVVAYRRGAAPELVDDGITGFLADDAEGLVDGIRRAATLDRRRCRARAEARFSAGRMVDGYLAIYHQLVAGVGAPASREPPSIRASRAASRGAAPPASLLK